jgi:hypothetical protein
MMKLSGNLISITEKPQIGLTTRYAQGAPALMAWKMLCLCGAKAIEDNEYDLLKFIMTDPIEVEEVTGKYSNRPLIERRDLFYPEAFLGYADIPMTYIDLLWGQKKYLHQYFDSKDNYEISIGKFFIMMALAGKPDPMGHPLFPGYRLLPHADKAMSSLTSRIFSSNDYLELVASVMGLKGSVLKETWAERVKPINAISTNGWHVYLFPANFGKESE